MEAPQPSPAPSTQSQSIFRTLVLFGVQVLAIWLSDQLMGSVQIASLWHTVVLAAVIGLLNQFLKPILILLTIPVTVFTLGLFLLVINGLIIALAAEIVPGFEVASFGSAILFSLALSFVSWMLEGLFGLRKSRIVIRRF
ncbi:MAG: phage holin family protein [Flavobacteriales bacterium]|nr:phage holin family protein [Flavobacteriales bacterium]MCX7649663.1 phage holin family protein [Flavobacteriales bacterium]MDW8432156.1 phage holin family protein [Flavobacteriales bacterium]